MSTIEQTVEDLLSEQDWTGKIFSDGWVDAPETIETIEPATGEVLGTAGVANAASVAAAAKSAARAQRDWAALPMAERVAVITPRGRAARTPPGGDRRLDGARVRVRSRRRWSTRSARRSDSSNEAASLISASARAGAGVADPGTDVDRPSRADRRRRRDHAVELPDRAGDALARPGARARATRSCSRATRTRPCRGGVVIARIFEEAGLPSGVLHVLCGGPEVGQALVEDPNVRMISFTGSTKTGRMVGEAAGRGLKRVVLELGGNSPLIVLEDADIEAASSAGAWGSFLHQGQICLAVSRHLVHESIAEEYLAALDRAGRPPARRQPGDERGARSARSSTRSRSSACSGSSTRRSRAGATASSAALATACSSRRPCCATYGPEMAAFKEEIFGPVAAVTTFKTDDEAVELANATEYGLSAAVQSGSQERADAVAARPRGGHGPRQRPDRQRGAAGAVRRLQVLEQRRPLRRRGPARAVDRVAVADVEGEGRAVPVLDDMKAALLREYHRPLELVDRPRPEVAHPTDVLVRIGGAGVCATDLHAIEGLMEPAGVTLPRVLGHENAGWVEELGDARLDRRQGRRSARLSALQLRALRRLPPRQRHALRAARVHRPVGRRRLCGVRPRSERSLVRAARRRRARRPSRRTRTPA